MALRYVRSLSGVAINSVTDATVVRNFLRSLASHCGITGYRLLDSAILLMLFAVSVLYFSVKSDAYSNY